MADERPASAGQADVRPSGPYLYEVHPRHRQGRGRFWRHEGKGYTDALGRAGVFDTPDNGETFEARPLSSYADEIARELRRAEEQVGGLTRLHAMLRGAS